VPPFPRTRGPSELGASSGDECVVQVECGDFDRLRTRLLGCLRVVATDDEAVVDDPPC
jgi:hypothetical protein